ncbi:hypothetical protein CLAFUW4_00280 [Fulvia fulva]|uniref:Uncharacterized protein n=1 Tax=Passalora fulva TaxID=5499 RepID=A0A1P8YXT4_PASFU|nr:uncharacterized protein CLAFUR5_00281 [Fulvia fulva]AQA29323.1 hypothetical protein 30 [Fulvia fulva]KAK4634715.1 hypothetical protein CLAFUR4_00280 [Fulvia fulva]KAK4637285.1 hypothetical protein CLAFUR0_00281 [Fulvia fulva]UJO10902.1 hypothetical protein CLAFUR5_00281 [Fulvia fulva]WPV10319.1 hypothetical protein CLAFUW4_00280 [Fulvia fulva]
MLASNSFTIKAIAFGALALTASAAVPTDNKLWKVPARIEGDSLELAWQQLPVKSVKVDTAWHDGRTFSYYPFIYNFGGTLYLLFSASAKDIDGMGQEVRISSSNDAGITWSKPEVAFPAALLPNQTTVKNSKYYCDGGIPQRALQPLTITSLPGGSFQVFAVAQSSDNICPGYFQSAGRIARELNVHGSGTGLFMGDPCWIETNDYTGAHEWAETVYGTQYGMKVCEQKDVINTAVNEPDSLGPVATQLFNSPIIASDGQHNVTYPTKAVWHNSPDGSGYWQRFWQDASVRNNTGSAWVEYSTDRDGKNWFPATDSGSQIHETNIYQEGEKAHFGAFESTEQLRYYVSNGGMTKALDQELLTIATSRGDDPAFHKIGIVRGGNAGKKVARGTRGLAPGVPGFYWPSAAEVGDKLAIAYSENRQVIWVSVIEEAKLP